LPPGSTPCNPTTTLPACPHHAPQRYTGVPCIPRPHPGRDPANPPPPLAGGQRGGGGADGPHPRPRGRQHPAPQRRRLGPRPHPRPGPRPLHLPPPFPPPPGGGGLGARRGSSPRRCPTTPGTPPRPHLYWGGGGVHRSRPVPEWDNCVTHLVGSYAHNSCG